MKTTIFASVAAFALASSVALADDFDNTGLTLVAETGKLEFTLEGAQNTGYTSATVAYEALSYNLGENITNTLDVFVAHYDLGNEFGVGAEYTMTYSPNALSVYGSAEVEYLVDAEDFFVTPTVGAAYTVAEGVDAWAEVGYTWNASNDWARNGGVAEVGVDFAVAENITLTPSIVHTFDTANDETQANIGVKFSF
jgi:opacity protein-like surface antigen